VNGWRRRAYPMSSPPAWFMVVTAAGMFALAAWSIWKAVSMP
jgi:hypothetical protein